jgi:pimeloyl-ACP methyl ester carboxylesterase
MTDYFKSTKGKQQILDLYDTKLEELNISYDYLQVETRFGLTNIIVTGSPSSPPLIVVHGSNGCAPIALEAYPNLASKFRVYAIDVLAQPNKTLGERLSMKDASYGIWMNEIMDELKLDEVTLAGFSFGGLVILKTLEYKESKVKEVFLASPAYIVNGNPIKALLKIFLPMKRYMKRQNIKHVERFLSEVFTTRDEFAVQYLSKVFLEFDMDFTPVPVIETKNARKITTPITLFAAAQDILFPGKKMIKRAENIFPSLNTSHILNDSKHVQNAQHNKRIEEAILSRQ